MYKTYKNMEIYSNSVSWISRNVFTFLRQISLSISSTPRLGPKPNTCPSTVSGSIIARSCIVVDLCVREISRIFFISKIVVDVTYAFSELVHCVCVSLNLCDFVSLNMMMKIVSI